jgi:hypothetical protein
MSLKQSQGNLVFLGHERPREKILLAKIIIYAKIHINCLWCNVYTLSIKVFSFERVL